jgi:hypothetical protein
MMISVVNGVPMCVGALLLFRPLDKTLGFAHVFLLYSACGLDAVAVTLQAGVCGVTHRLLSLTLGNERSQFGIRAEFV